MNILKLTSIALSVYKSPGLIRPLHHPIPSRYHHPVTTIFKLIPYKSVLSTIPLWKNQLQPPFTFHPSHFTLPFQSSLFKMKAVIILTLLATIGTALPTSPQQDDKSLDRRVR